MEVVFAKVEGHSIDLVYGRSSSWLMKVIFTAYVFEKVMHLLSLCLEGRLWMTQVSCLH